MYVEGERQSHACPGLEVCTDPNRVCKMKVNFQMCRQNKNFVFHESALNGPVLWPIKKIKQTSRADITNLRKYTYAAQADASSTTSVHKYNMTSAEIVIGPYHPASARDSFSSADGIQAVVILTFYCKNTTGSL